jgi:hypothetical protein
MTPEPGRAEVEAASENGKPFDLKDRLLAGMVGGCGCGVKSPEINFHSARCKYAMAAMAYEVIELKDKRLDDQSGAIRELAAEVTSLRAEVERLTRERERLAAQGIADLEWARHEITALCENTEDDPAINKVASEDTESKPGAFCRGRIVEAKGIRRPIHQVLTDRIRERKVVALAQGPKP